MGRPRKPTAVRIAEGVRGHRPLNESEPQPSPGAPDRCPPGLSKWAQTLWREIVAELDALGLLTVVDRGAFEAAIIGADQGHEADRAVRKFTAKVNSGKASREDFYHLSVMNNVSKKGWNQYKAFCVEFGCTPASRTRLTADPAAPVASRSGQQKIADPIEAALCEMPVQ